MISHASRACLAGRASLETAKLQDGRTARLK